MYVAHKRLREDSAPWPILQGAHPGQPQGRRLPHRMSGGRTQNGPSPPPPESRRPARLPGTERDQTIRDPTDAGRGPKDSTWGPRNVKCGDSAGGRLTSVWSDWHRLAPTALVRGLASVRWDQWGWTPGMQRKETINTAPGRPAALSMGAVAVQCASPHSAAGAGPGGMALGQKYTLG